MICQLAIACHVLCQVIRHFCGPEKIQVIAFIKSIFLPVLKNKVFFFNIILLIIIPSIINAYWINHEQYITISPIYKYGIKIRDGASFPYIIFVPFVFSFLLSTISMGLKCLSNKIEKLYRFFCLWAFTIFIYYKCFSFA